MNQNIEECRKEIIKYCYREEMDIRKQFSPPLTYKQFEKLLVAENWKRVRTETIETMVVRTFDCLPFNNKISGCISIDKEDSQVYMVMVKKVKGNNKF
jgi:hypothetical protein